MADRPNFVLVPDPEPDRAPPSPPAPPCSPMSAASRHGCRSGRLRSPGQNPLRPRPGQGGRASCSASTPLPRASPPGPRRARSPTRWCGRFRANSTSRSPSTAAPVCTLLRISPPTRTAAGPGGLDHLPLRTHPVAAAARPLARRARRTRHHLYRRCLRGISRARAQAGRRAGEPGIRLIVLHDTAHWTARRDAELFLDLARRTGGCVLPFDASAPGPAARVARRGRRVRGRRHRTARGQAARVARCGAAAAAPQA